ncbi:MAG: glycosyltransferase [Clostridium sp.]|nr:glycosyltransferase [Clostridium sp.]MCM1458771.1 glycosyltransferase [Bacteroides sp.]
MGVGHMCNNLLQKLSEGMLDVSLFEELFAFAKDASGNEKRKLVEDLLSYIGINIQQDIFIYSYILKLYPNETYLCDFINLILSDNALDWKQLNFLHWQIGTVIFMNPEMNTIRTVSLNWRLLQKTFCMCKKALGIDLTPIPKEQRNKELAVVITGQFLREQHGPTKTALDRCCVLQKKLGKRVLLINTAELLTMQGTVPFFGAMAGNYIPELLEEQTVSWKGETFQYYQCENIMPGEDEIVGLIDAVKRLKPSVVVEIGGSSLVAGLVNELIPVLDVGTIQSGCSQTLVKYQVIDANMLDYANTLMKAMDKDLSHIIQGKFTFALKKQTESVKRGDFGIRDDAFVMAVVGARLDEEMDECFLQFLDDTVRDNMLIAVIGKCDSFEQKLSKHPGLKNYMVNLGFCSDVLSRLELCDLYINPTRRGGGTSVVEAMFKGKPAITVDFGDVAGIVGDRFSCKDYNEMGKLIERYYEDKEFYREQSDYARQLADVYLDSDNEFVRIVKEYESREGEELQCVKI